MLPVFLKKFFKKSINFAPSWLLTDTYNLLPEFSNQLAAVSNQLTCYPFPVFPLPVTRLLLFCLVEAIGDLFQQSATSYPLSATSLQQSATRYLLTCYQNPVPSFSVTFPSNTPLLQLTYQHEKISL